ncbi:hypothetical protein BKA81DRAFT_394596 [Phyllosticta paracitricarpa]
MACHAILARSVALLLLLLPRRKNPNPITRLGCREGRFIGPGEGLSGLDCQMIPSSSQSRASHWRGVWLAKRLRGRSRGGGVLCKENKRRFPNAADDAKRRQYTPAEIDDDFLDQRRPSCPHDVFTCTSKEVASLGQNGCLQGCVRCKQASVMDARQQDECMDIAVAFVK